MEKSKIKIIIQILLMLLFAFSVLNSISFLCIYLSINFTGNIIGLDMLYFINLIASMHISYNIFKISVYKSFDELDKKYKL